MLDAHQPLAVTVIVESGLAAGVWSGKTGLEGFVGCHEAQAAFLSRHISRDWRVSKEPGSSNVTA